MTIAIFMVTIWLAAAVQTRLPTLWWAGGLRLELVPALVAVGALSLNRRPAVLLAALAGLAQDALSAAPFGLTALAYGAAALAISWMRDVLDRDLIAVQFAAGALAATAGSAAAAGVVGYTFGAVVKIVVLAVLAGIATPPTCLVAGLLQDRFRAARS